MVPAGQTSEVMLLSDISSSALPSAPTGRQCRALLICRLPSLTVTFSGRK